MSKSALTSSEAAPAVSTAFLLMARYHGAPIIPLDAVVRDFFPHVTTDKFLKKALAGAISIPVVRMETSQKTAKGIHLQDLADYIDAQRAAAVRECEALRLATA